ncbi:hypothetical protein JCM3765_007715 [Sporobolomyces pararoseus]
MSSSPEQPEPIHLILRDPLRPSSTFVKKWSSEGGTVEIGRAPKEKEKEAQDPGTPFFRSDKTKVMSSSHAQVIWKKGVPHLSDSGSTNGTFVNEQLLKPGDSHEIVTGDRITFGRLVTSRHDGETGQPLVLVAEVLNSLNLLPPLFSTSASRLNAFGSSPSPEAKCENKNQEEEDLFVIAEPSSDLEHEDGPACTLAASTQLFKKKKGGYGVPPRFDSDSSDQEEEQEEEDMEVEVEVEDEVTWSYSELMEQATKKHDGTAAETSTRDDSDARSPFSSRLPSPVSPDQVRSTLRTSAAALDLSASGFFGKDFPHSNTNSNSQTGIYFSQRILEDNRRKYFARRSDYSDHSSSSASSRPSFGVPVLSNSSSTSSLLVGKKKKEEEKEEDAFSQASQLPSPQLSACSSVAIDLTDDAQPLDFTTSPKVEEPLVGGEGEGEGGTITTAEEESEVEENETTSFSPILTADNDRPISSQFKKLDEVIERLSKKIEEEERLAQEKKDKEVEAEGKGSESADDGDGRDTIDAWLESLSEEDGQGEAERDECDFDGADPPPHGVLSTDLETTPPVEKNLFDLELDRDGFEEPDNGTGLSCADPDVDSYLFEIDVVFGGDPDFDSADPDGMDNDVDADMEVLKEEEEEVGSGIKADQPSGTEETQSPQDPHLAYAGHLLAMFDEKPSDSAENATFIPSSSLAPVSRVGKKRSLSETDLEEEEEEKEPSLVEDTPARVFAPQPKRRRIAAHVAAFAFGFLGGVVGAIAGLSAVGAALGEDLD